MTLKEIREFKVGLLDLVNEQASEPVPDLDSVRDLVDAFIGKLEIEHGEEESK